ncbi:hypothetical protein JCM1840_003419, partial [Sporobolomyces johnsonii]
MPVPHLFVTPPPQPVFQRKAAPSPESPDPLDFLSDPFVAQAVALTAAVNEDLGTHDEAFSPPSRDPHNHREALVDVNSDGWLNGEKGEFLSLLSPQRPQVAKFTSIRVLLALAAQQRMRIQQADVDKAYFHADLDEELCMRVPDGVDGPEWDGKVLKLDRALYGLKQVGRAWNAKIHAMLEHLGYQRTVSDVCIYGGLRKQYGIKDLGDASCILGIDLVRRPDGSVFLSQRAYLETVLARLGQANCHPASTPMIPN